MSAAKKEIEIRGPQEAPESERLQEVMERVRDDAKRHPEDYLRKTVVEKGGE